MAETALDAMPHPDSFIPEMSDAERLEAMAPDIARVVLRHHVGHHELGVDLEDAEALEAVGKLGKELKKHYPASYIPSDVVPSDPEAIKAMHDALDERIAWFEGNGVNARPIIDEALITNLTTEDNLPGYKHELYEDEAGLLDIWNGSWVADEYGHAILLSRYAESSGAITDFRAYEEQRPTYMYNGTSVDIRGLTHGVVYPGGQEIATIFPHKYVGMLVGGDGEKAHNVVAADETRHAVAYRELTKSDMRVALESGHPEYINHVAATIVHTLHPKNFEMPAKGRMEKYRTLALNIMTAGLFDPILHRSMMRRFTEEIGLEEFAEHVTDPDVKAAIAEFMEDISLASESAVETQKKLDAHREKKIEAANRAGELRPLIVGHTVDLRIRNPDMSKITPSGEYVNDETPEQKRERVKIIAA